MVRTRTTSPPFYEQIYRYVSWAPVTHSPPHKMFHLVLFNDKLTPYSMEQSPWESNRFSASQEIPHILWNSKVHYRIHKCPPTVLSWDTAMQSIPPHPTSWRSILILSSHLRLGLPSGLFPSGFPTKTLYTPLFSPIRATWPAHLKFNDKAKKKWLALIYKGRKWDC